MTLSTLHSIRPIRNCLYGNHIEYKRRHSYKPVSRALVGAPASARVQEGCARSHGAPSHCWTQRRPSGGAFNNGARAARQSAALLNASGQGGKERSQPRLIGASPCTSNMAMYKQFLICLILGAAIIHNLPVFIAMFLIVIFIKCDKVCLLP